MKMSSNSIRIPHSPSRELPRGTLSGDLLVGGDKLATVGCPFGLNMLKGRGLGVRTLNDVGQRPSCPRSTYPISVEKDLPEASELLAVGCLERHEGCRYPRRYEDHVRWKRVVAEHAKPQEGMFPG